MSEGKPENPLVRGILGKPVSAFEVHLYRAEYFGDLQRQQKSWAAIDQSSRLRLKKWIVHLELRVGRYIPALLATFLKEAPFHTDQGVSHGPAIRSTSIAVEKIGHLVLQLNPIPQAVVDVEKGSLNFSFLRTAEVRGGDVDFPVSIARGARVVGEQWGAALSKNLCRAAKNQRDPCEIPRDTFHWDGDVCRASDGLVFVVLRNGRRRDASSVCI